MPTSPEFFDIDGLAAYLGMLDAGGKPARRPVYEMNRNGTGPPFYRIGGKCRYRRAQVEEWIESRAVTRKAS